MYAGRILTAFLTMCTYADNGLDVLATWQKRRLASHCNLDADYAAEREYYYLMNLKKIKDK